MALKSSATFSQIWSPFSSSSSRMGSPVSSSKSASPVSSSTACSALASKLYMIPKLATTSSLATRPVTVAAVGFQSPKPRGLKTMETGWATRARMESSIGSTSSSEMPIRSATMATYSSVTRLSSS